MSQIKYYIFVFIVLITSLNYSQNKIEGDSTLEKNKVEIAVNNAEKQIQNGNYYNALKTLKQALLNSENIEDKKGQGIILSKIAKIQYNIDKYKDAVYSINKAIDIQLNIDDELNLAISRNTYGLIYLGQKDYFKALEYFKSARTIFEEDYLNELITEVTLSEAKAHIGLNNLVVANTLVEKAIILSKKYKLTTLQGAALINSGIIASKLPARLNLGLYLEANPEVKMVESLTLDIKLGRKLFGRLDAKFKSIGNDQPGVIIIPLFNILIEKEVDFIVVARAEGYAATTVLKKHISQGNVGQTIVPNALPQPS